MKNIFVTVSLLAILLALYFGGVAFQKFEEENMDEVYLNIGYCALFLSSSVYSWHLKEERQKNT
ncbi:protein YpmT [Metabacillus herbersteinensis]|uniref:Protein YpmT n=1 Tax=Metabacillus herbersteinensis TaxID=283816 RepID=A0ABV6GKX0_9BACI